MQHCLNHLAKISKLVFKTTVVALLAVVPASNAFAQTSQEAMNSTNEPASLSSSNSPSSVGGDFVSDPRAVQRTMSFGFKDCWNRIKYLGKDLSTYKRTRGMDGFFRFVVPSGYVFRCDLPQFPKAVSERVTQVRVNTPGLFASGNKIAFKSDWLTSADDFISMRNDWNDLPSSVNVVVFVGLSGASATIEVRDRQYDDYFLNLQDQAFSNLPRVVESPKQAWMVAREALEQVLGRSISVYVEGIEN